MQKIGNRPRATKAFAMNTAKAHACLGLVQQSGKSSATFAAGTTATRLGSCQPAFENSASATNIRRDCYGVYRAVERARATLHAMIFIHNESALTGYGKDLMRADSHTHAAADTFFFRQRERDNILQIYMIHMLPLSDKALGQEHGNADRDRDGNQRDGCFHFLCDAGKRGVRGRAGKIHCQVCGD